jgi:hypothetical protein
MTPRQTAIQNGDKTYEGKPCKRGHTTRYISKNCVECTKEYHENNREEKIKMMAQYYNNNKEKINTPRKKELSALWFQNNKEKINKKNRERYKNDLIFRVKQNMKRHLHHFLKQVGGTKTGRTEELLGYTAEELKTRLESLFQEGMTWDNQGDWHIDHIIPQSYFTSIDQIRECFALSNLKPEWGEWNMSKGNRFIGSSEDYPQGITL